MKKKVPNFVKGLKKLPYLSEKNIPILKQKTPLGKLKFWSYGATPEFRVRTLLTKEPETINWINSFNKKSIFWDIGANIGIYSLYASLLVNKVFSFEPSSLNYFILNKNIYLNNKHTNIKSLNIAFSNKDCLDRLYMSSLEGGDASHSFSKKNKLVVKKMKYIFQQSCIGYSIDNFIKKFKVSVPNYIKIDVDGIEYLILKGASKTLKNKKLKSILIEVNEDNIKETESICKLMKRSGFNKCDKRHSPYYEDYYYKPFFNYLFNRK